MNALVRRILPLAAAAILAALPAARAAGAPAPSFKTDLLHDLQGVSEQVVALAQAVPADKFAWRPAPGVRSIAEAYMHMAAGNYEILGFSSWPAAGAPADLGKFETSTADKAEVVAALEKSIRATREAIEKIPDSAMDKPVRPGSKTTVRALLLEVPGHLHEHLGQEIAYARMNGVVPPWTAARQQQQSQQAPPKSGR